MRNCEPEKLLVDLLTEGTSCEELVLVQLALRSCCKYTCSQPSLSTRRLAQYHLARGADNNSLRMRKYLCDAHASYRVRVSDIPVQLLSSLGTYRGILHP